MERTDEFVVEDGLLTDAGGTLGFSVLSTPGMIGKFFFDVEVREGDRVLGVGTHQRRLVQAR